MILELSIDFNSSLFEISWLDKNILKKIFLNFLGKVGLSHAYLEMTFFDDLLDYFIGMILLCFL